jgi:hypothetical protein
MECLVRLNDAISAELQGDYSGNNFLFLPEIRLTSAAPNIASCFPAAANFFCCLSRPASPGLLPAR